MRVSKTELEEFKKKPYLVETLTILVEKGPVDKGELLHADFTRALVKLGYAVHIVKQLQDGYYAATMLGRDMYKVMYGTSFDGVADTMCEAHANRMAGLAMKNARGS